MNKEEKLIDEIGNKYYVLKNKKINIKSPKIINLIEDMDLLYGKMYFQHKLIHKEDGPAIEYINGGKEYWVYGEIKTEVEYNHFIRNTKIESLNDELNRELKINKAIKKIKI